MPIGKNLPGSHCAGSLPRHLQDGAPGFKRCQAGIGRRQSAGDLIRIQTTAGRRVFERFVLGGIGRIGYQGLTFFRNRMSITLRRLLWMLTVLSLIVVVLVPVNPVSSLLQHTVLLAAMGVVWAGLLTLGWRRRTVRWTLLAVPVLSGGFLLLPARGLEQQPGAVAELRADYVKELRRLVGVPYFWGGESARGIDCSGLPRRALRQALLKRAARYADPGSLRLFLELWWFDTSARAMSEGYRGFTRDLKMEDRVATVDGGKLRPGDLAVTAGGAHVLIFLGGEEWIQADPGEGKVIALNARRDHNSWFQHAVTMHRWTAFGD